MALILGGGGLMAANVYASATEGVLGGQSESGSAQTWAAAGATINCPDVSTRITEVPDEARAEVDKQLAVLDQQIAKAYQQVQSAVQDGRMDAATVNSKIMKPLQEERAGTIGRIADAIDRAGDRPEGLDDLAACTLRDAGNQNGGNQNGGEQSGGDQGGQDQGQNDQGQNGQDQGQQGDGQQGGNGGQAGNGPVVADYADITTVQPNVTKPREGENASRGTFSTDCGVNENGLFNSDNVIVAPGVANGAHHFHDYVGNQANTAFASDEDLAQAETTCQDQRDKSSYFWPVLRLQDGTQERDANSPGGGLEGNVGRIVTPKEVTLTFEGNPRSKVTAMPRFLRIITGDAKSFVNGPANANASWSCTGFEDRQLKDKYPLCPQGSDVVRTFKFQSCWDGRNTDSANHRTHVAFADAEGNCPEGFRAIPQLVQRIVYDVDAPSLEDGGKTTPLFAVDSFPEQLHKPITDHSDFINVFDDELMREVVDCINSGKQCGAGAGQGGEPGEQPQEPQDEPTQTTEPSTGGNDGAGAGKDGKGNGDNGNKGNGDKDNGQNGKAGGEQPAEEPANGGASTAPGAVEPKADTSRPAVQDTADAAPAGGEAGTPTQTPNPGNSDLLAGAQTEPQAVRGGLASTGAQLWPAAAGAVLVIVGFVLLRRIRRSAA
ncbi:DUF1996 domain-containing protein [Streptomyces thermoalcalitolerans]|uniref:DUF1996 domain-containing protein n=1 Tax=Streptomyces thermoalcalitolerans TaxID=65605 RepID=A0ABN1PBW1_9ACTN